MDLDRYTIKKDLILQSVRLRVKSRLGWTPRTVSHVKDNEWLAKGRDGKVARVIVVVGITDIDVIRTVA